MQGVYFFLNKHFCGAPVIFIKGGCQTGFVCKGKGGAFNGNLAGCKSFHNAHVCGFQLFCNQVCNFTGIEIDCYNCNGD